MIPVTMKPDRPAPPVPSPWSSSSRPSTPQRAAREPRAGARAAETRLYGVNACRAAFAHRPEALRKVYLLESRIAAFKPVLAWCVKHRVGYRVVEADDLDRLTASRHHEGVCFDLVRRAPLDVAGLLAQVPAAPAASLLLWLDGVGNPHNFGALLRSAAHFGASGVITPADVELSGAAARVAEGAAEVVPLAQTGAAAQALTALRAHGFAIAATVPRAGTPLYATALPPRLVLVFGAEGEGMSQALIEAADLRLTIPGSGQVESLNVAASVAVVLGEYWRAHAPHA